MEYKICRIIKNQWNWVYKEKDDVVINLVNSGEKIVCTIDKILDNEIIVEVAQPNPKTNKQYTYETGNYKTINIDDIKDLVALNYRGRRIFG